MTESTGIHTLRLSPTHAFQAKAYTKFLPGAVNIPVAVERQDEIMIEKELTDPSLDTQEGRRMFPTRRIWRLRIQAPVRRIGRSGPLQAALALRPHRRPRTRLTVLTLTAHPARGGMWQGVVTYWPPDSHAERA